MQKELDAELKDEGLPTAGQANKLALVAVVCLVLACAATAGVVMLIFS